MVPNSDYLALIQGVISRMANNAFLIKGWSITLTAALLAVVGSLSSSGSLDKNLFFIVNSACLLGFIWLDAYFYYNEKKYRELYDYARDMSRFKIEDLYNLNANLVIPEANDTNIKVRLGAIKSTAVYPVYLMQLILIFVIYIIAL
ncbi:hypothetical protein QTV35_004557 [Vibrio parahaemolyticus]|uniref:hypothetical protein n=1 Tax=Vibrio parahaemolyticus TaxID=670 RepID=UPI0006902E1E|nr:hypothetical protein [Vibrio parahaemolyticus]EHH1106548.1 hypothetical protein [Vibrio parahaemolyticus]EHH1935403.1 hypothetical protein [Vibrio parahaemolyticus]EIU6756949.1 hypothetical protein [Vibrio parahaemolyticus]EIZ1043036.1 hypothetical protein [Vibrio parahaemolyticus]ELA9412542.1 hypothetical protein [Vibrio parahaemolyticus]